MITAKSIEEMANALLVSLDLGTDDGRRREQVFAFLLAVRSQVIGEIADWISSSMASAMFGSDSWCLRNRIAKVIRDRSWETVLQNEVAR